MRFAKWPVRKDTGSLERTTLQFSGADSLLSYASAIDDLKRVPGVLTVELDIDSDRAQIAHDSGVDASSLLAAARRGGTRVRVLEGPPPQTIGFDVTVGPFGAWSRFLLAFATALCAATAITQIFFRRYAAALAGVRLFAWIDFLNRSDSAPLPATPAPISCIRSTTGSTI